jgi:hypothetical protein
MAFRLNTVDRLQRYLLGVSERASHHAPNVGQVILAMAGAIVLYKDPGTHLEARTYRGSPSNVVYARINNTRYALSYDHEHQSVVIRQNSVRGTSVGSFTNTTTPQQVIRVFSGL